jgi:DNA-binding beta-propeller fold protein YncE
MAVEFKSRKGNRMRVWSRSSFIFVLAILALIVGAQANSGIDARPAVGIGQIYVTARGAILRMNDITGAGLAVLGPAGTWINASGGCSKPLECAGVTGYEYGASGIFIDETHKIYIADSAQNRIVQIGVGVTSLGTKGEGVGQFNQPDGIFVDAANRIYVVDSGNNRLAQMKDMTGAAWVTLGRQGRGVSHFDSPTGISVDKAGRIYVADSGNRRIVRVNDITGAGWTTFGTAGAGVGQFGALNGVFVDRTGRIYVADTGNGRIVRVNDMKGAGWMTLGKCPPECTVLNVPLGIFVDQTGRLYVADWVSMYKGRIVRVNDMTGAGWAAFDLPGIPRGIFVR